MTCLFRGFLLACVLMVPSLPVWPVDIEGQKPVLFIGESFQFIPGAWSSYTVRDAAGKEDYRFWIATLGKRKGEGKPRSWMEIEVESAATPAVVTRFLVNETPQGPGKLHEVIVQMRGYSPFVVPEKYYEGAGKEVGNFQSAHTLRRVGERLLEVRGRVIPVVEVEALDANGRPVNATVSEAVPPIGVVFAEANGVTMRLDDWGTGARSRVEGDPVNFYWWLIQQVGRELFK